MICSSAIGFDSRVDGKRLTFGFEGIWQGTAVLYDHQTNSFWMHITGECFHGPHTGTFLTPLETGRHTTWAEWMRTHPETDVLAYDPRLGVAGSEHGYFPRDGARSGQAFLPPAFPGTIETVDERLPANTLVRGVLVGSAARAYPLPRLARHGVVEELVGGVELTVWYDPESRSAAAYHRRVDGRRLSFRPSGAGRVEDVETGSVWSLEGRAVSGPLAGTTLVRARGLLSEWYGWRASYPQTTIFE